MVPTTYLRRIDGQRVEAVQVSSDTIDEVRAIVAGYRIDGSHPDRLTFHREHPYGVVKVVAGDWLIRDDDQLYAVRSYAFHGHCRPVPVE